MRVQVRVAPHPSLGRVQLRELQVGRLPRGGVAQDLVAHRDGVVVKPKLGVLVHRLVVVVRSQAGILQLYVEIADAVVDGKVRIALILIVQNLEPDLYGLLRLLGLEKFCLFLELLEL